MITNKPRQSLWSLFSPYSSKDSLDLKVGSAVMLMEGIWQDNIPPCLVMITLDTGSANMFSNLNSLVSAEKKYNQEPCRLKKWARSHKVRTDLNQIIIFSEVCKIKYFLMVLYVSALQHSLERLQLWVLWKCKLDKSAWFCLAQEREALKHFVMGLSQKSRRLDLKLEV